MEQKAIIEEWERRARAAGISVAELCRRAGIHQPSFCKWKVGENGITLASIHKVDAALSAAECDQAA